MFEKEKKTPHINKKTKKKIPSKIKCSMSLKSLELF